MAFLSFHKLVAKLIRYLANVFMCSSEFRGPDFRPARRRRPLAAGPPPDESGHREGIPNGTMRPSRGVTNGQCAPNQKARAPVMRDPSRGSDLIARDALDSFAGIFARRAGRPMTVAWADEGSQVTGSAEKTVDDFRIWMIVGRRWPVVSGTCEQSRGNSDQQQRAPGETTFPSRAREDCANISALNEVLVCIGAAIVCKAFMTFRENGPDSG
jgi:hypothetical protein